MQDERTMNERRETVSASCRSSESPLADQPVKPLTELAGSVQRMLDIIAELTAASQGQAAVPDRAEQTSLPLEKP